MTGIAEDFGLPVPGDVSLSVTGTTFATALVLTKKMNVLSTVASGGICVLPGSYAPGSQITVMNRASANAVLVAPSKGDMIEELAVDATVSVPTGYNVTFVSFDPPAAPPPRTWYRSNTEVATGSYLPLAGGTVTGATTFSAAGTGLAVTNAATVGGTLGVTGAFNGYLSSGTNLASGGNLYIGGSGTEAAGRVAVGSENVFLGDRAGSTAVASSFNVAIGHNAYGAGATSPPIGSSNTFVGTDSGRNVSGNVVGNTGVGTNALAGPALTGITGILNTALGYHSGIAVTTGNQNTTIGEETGVTLTTGSSNTILGSSVASTVLTTGSRNILIGVDASTTTAAAGTSDTLLIKGTGTAVMTATGLNGTPLVLIPGSAQMAGAGNSIGFFGTTVAAQQTVTGSKGANAALASLITALATYGLVVDSTS